MGDFTDPWEEYRRRRNWAVLAGAGYVPVVLLAVREAERSPQTVPLCIVVGGGWLAFLIVTGTRCEYFKCPRCGKPFFAKWWYHNAFARRCLHCGLPKYALTESNQSAEPK
jgi:hypothetical protein